MKVSLRLTVGLVVILLFSAFSLVVLTRQGSAEEPPVGRYVAVAPDLVLDTATGKLADAKGQVVSPPVDASGKTPGRYSAAGYSAPVVRSIWVDSLSRGQMKTDLVKGFVLVDTTTGSVVKTSVYARRPLTAQDF